MAATATGKVSRQFSPGVISKKGVRRGGPSRSTASVTAGRHSRIITPTGTGNSSISTTTQAPCFSRNLPPPPPRPPPPPPPPPPRPLRPCREKPPSRGGGPEGGRKMRGGGGGGGGGTR